MQPKQITWIGFLMALSALSIPTKTIAVSADSMVNNGQLNIENRLARLADNLKAREKELSDYSDSEFDSILDNNMLVGQWLKGYRGGFVNTGGGGFLNRHRPRWTDYGGFLNRRWPNGGGFLKRW